MNCTTLDSLSRKAVILLVEDNPDHVLLAQIALEQTSFAVDLQVTCNGIECMDFLYRRGTHVEAPRPDLILLDIHMPRMDGYEVLRQVRSDDTLRLIPVNLLTTSADLMDVKRMHELGCNSYIHKSSNFEYFEETMRRTIEYWLHVAVLPTTIED